MMPRKVVFVIFVSYFIVPTVFSNLWASVEESLSLSNTNRKPCMPPCKVFHSWCKNNGKCREKLPDCAWYCECPANCKGVFCERIVTKTNNEEKVDVQVELIKEKETETSAFDTLQLHAALANIYKKKNEKSAETPELKEKVESMTANDTKTLCLSDMLKKSDRQKNQTTNTTTEVTNINAFVNTSTDATLLTRTNTSTEAILLTYSNVSTDQTLVTHANTQTDANLQTHPNDSKDQTLLTHENTSPDATVLPVTDSIMITTTPSVQITLTTPVTSSATQPVIVPIVGSTAPTEAVTPEPNLRSTHEDYTTTENSTTLAENNTDKSTFVTESSNSFDSSSTLQTTTVLQSSTESSDVATGSTTVNASTINPENTTVDLITKSLLNTTTTVPSTDITQQQEQKTTTEMFLSNEMMSTTIVTHTSVITDKTTLILDNNTKGMQTTAKTSTVELQTNGNKQNFLVLTDASKTLASIPNANEMMVEASNIVIPDSVTDKVSRTTQSYESTSTDLESSTPSSNFSTSLTSLVNGSIEVVMISNGHMSSVQEHNNREQSNDSAHSSSTSGKFVDSLKNIIDSLIIKTEKENTRETAAQTKHDNGNVFDKVKADTASVNKSFETTAELNFTTDLQKTAGTTTELYTQQSTRLSPTTDESSIADVGTQTTPESSTISSGKSESSIINSSNDNLVNTTSSNIRNNTTMIDITVEKSINENATQLMSTGSSNWTTEWTTYKDRITKPAPHETNVSRDDTGRTEPVNYENIMDNKSAKVNKSIEITTNIIPPETTTSAEEQITVNHVMVSESQNNDSATENMIVDNNFTFTTAQAETTSQKLPVKTSALPQTTFDPSTPNFTVKSTSSEPIRHTSIQTKPNKLLSQQNNSMKSDDQGAVLYPDLAPLLDVLRKFRKSVDSPEKVPPKTLSNETKNGEMKELSIEVSVSKSKISNTNKTNVDVKEIMTDILSDKGIENYDVKNSEKQASFKDLGVIEESLKEGIDDMVKSVNLIDGEKIVNPREESKNEAGRDTLAVKSSKDQRNLS